MELTELIVDDNDYLIWKLGESQYIIGRDNGSYPDLYLKNFYFSFIDPKEHDNFKYRYNTLHPNTKLTYCEITWSEFKHDSVIITSIRHAKDLINVFRVAPDTWHAREVG